MVKLPRRFSVGERVFAKVRGYPPWPARIESVSDQNTKAPKYHVIFYGTRETGVCKIEDLFQYIENKEKFSKAQKRKLFRDGLLELEEDLKNNPDPATEAAARVSEATENVPENVEKGSEKSDTIVSPAAEGDGESGNLVIDEGDKKKGIKRKSTQGISTPEAPEAKKKRGRKSTSTILAESTPKAAESSHDSQDEDSERKVVSRSGRKIKPKRFHDYSDLEVPVDTSRNEDEKKVSAQQVAASSGKEEMIEAQNQIKSAKELAEAENNSLRVKILRIETQIMFLDTQIRSSLGLDQANVDECIDAMDQLNNFKITPLMLKKHYYIVETVKRLRRYVGNLNEWKLTEEETAIFKQKADIIKKKAELLYEKFKKQFTIPEGQTFWDAFIRQLDTFKEFTKDLSQEEFYSLLTDPTVNLKATEENKTIPIEEPVASTSSKDISLTETEVK